MRNFELYEHLESLYFERANFETMIFFEFSTKIWLRNWYLLTNNWNFFNKIRTRNFLTNLLETLFCVYISMFTENFNVSRWKSREIAKVAWVKIKRSDFERKKSGKKIHDFFHTKIIFPKKSAKDWNAKIYQSI